MGREQNVQGTVRHETEKQNDHRGYPSPLSVSTDHHNSGGGVARKLDNDTNLLRRGGGTLFPTFAFQIGRQLFMVTVTREASLAPWVDRLVVGVGPVAELGGLVVHERLDDLLLRVPGEVKGANVG